MVELYQINNFPLQLLKNILLKSNEHYLNISFFSLYPFLFQHDTISNFWLSESLKSMLEHSNLYWKCQKYHIPPSKTTFYFEKTTNPFGLIIVNNCIKYCSFTSYSTIITLSHHKFPLEHCTCELCFLPFSTSNSFGFSFPFFISFTFCIVLLSFYHVMYPTHLFHLQYCFKEPHFSFFPLFFPLFPFFQCSRAFFLLSIHSYYKRYTSILKAPSSTFHTPFRLSFLLFPSSHLTFHISFHFKSFLLFSMFLFKKRDQLCSFASLLASFLLSLLCFNVRGLFFYLSYILPL